MKHVRTATYNYNFNESNGYFERWGTSLKDDPSYSPIGLEILDIEVSTICSKGCKFCYKSNITKGENMTLDTFGRIIDKLPTLTQVAFGIGDIDANPDLFNMFLYCRNKGIVPNVTINGVGLTKEWATKLSFYCGAVAVSHYSDNECYDAVEQLTNLGMDQINIHQLLAEETFEDIKRLLVSYKEDARLSKLNAIVFLSLKQKGRGEGYNVVSDDKFKWLIDYCMENNVRFGADSCSACKILKSIEGNPRYEEIAQTIEPCESGLFSGYVSTQGIFYPCSFSEGLVEGIDLKGDLDFLQDVWYNSTTMKWRKNLISCGRDCPIYNV